MSQITFEDFEFSSEEEYPQAEHAIDEDNLVQDSDDDSNEGEASNYSTDIDEYANFSTDYERYQWDQARWSGIPNTRKHPSAKKPRKSKGEEKGHRENAQEDSFEKQDKGNAQPMRRRRGKSQSDASSGQAVDIPEEGEIHFGARGDLWYTHISNNVPVSERATFHHWNRYSLGQIANANGEYDSPRKRGIASNDITSFSKIQEHWGLERPQYAPVMFEWQRRGRADPAYRLGNVYYQGLLVLDYWRTPVRNFREIPTVISSGFEGAFIEPALRLHSKMGYEDIRARMPPFILVRKNHLLVFKALPKASALSQKCRRFREKAGAISWDGREGSSLIKSFIEDIVKPVNNSTRGSRDLTKEEVGKLRLMNHGTKPTRAKAGTTEKSKEHYIAHTLKAAGVISTTRPRKEADNIIENPPELEAGDEEAVLTEGGNRQELSSRGWEVNYLLGYDSLRNDSDEFVDNPLASEKDIDTQEDNSRKSK